MVGTHIVVEGYLVGCSYHNDDITEKVKKVPSREQWPPLFPTELDMKLVFIECSHCLQGSKSKIYGWYGRLVQEVGGKASLMLL
jgi:hypothetical protein